MPIHVCYDITVLGNYFNRFDCKSGIFRVIEEVLYEMLKRKDVELTVMGMCDDNFLFNSLSSYFYIRSRKEQIDCHFSNSFKSKIGLTKLYFKYFDFSLTSQLQEMPRYAGNLIFTRVVRKILYSIYKWDIIPFMDYNKFDIFHSTYLKIPPEEITGSLPRILTVYDIIPVTAPKFVSLEMRLIFQNTLNSINTKRDWIICISEYTKLEFCEYMKMSPDRVFVAPLAAASHFYPVMNTDRISAVCQRYHISDSDYFLSLAAPQPRKNLVHLIRCFFRLLSERSDLDVNLVLVGSKDLGWMHNDIFEAAESSTEFRSRVIFTGYIPDEELSEIYSGAKAFIFPSLYEGFGLPALEAMQCGTPVITSDTTSLPEVVGDAGILVDPKDEDSLCQAMLDVLNNAALRQELSRKGLERATRFSWARCAADTVKVYEAAISNR